MLSPSAATDAARTSRNARERAAARIDAVSPGVVETPWWNTVTSEARQACFAPHASELPVGRVGQPDDGAQVIAFLVGKGCATSIVMECDGGSRLA